MLFSLLCNPMYTLQLLHTSRQNTVCKLKVAYNNAIHSLMGFPRWFSANAMFFNEGILSFAVVTLGWLLHS